jgi:hypothetical protein
MCWQAWIKISLVFPCADTNRSDQICVFTATWLCSFTVSPNLHDKRWCNEIPLLNIACNPVPWQLYSAPFNSSVQHRQLLWYTCNCLADVPLFIVFILSTLRPTWHVHLMCHRLSLWMPFWVFELCCACRMVKSNFCNHEGICRDGKELYARVVKVSHLNWRGGLTSVHHPITLFLGHFISLRRRKCVIVTGSPYYLC